MAKKETPDVTLMRSAYDTDIEWRADIAKALHAGRVVIAIDAKGQTQRMEPHA